MGEDYITRPSSIPIKLQTMKKLYSILSALFTMTLVFSSCEDVSDLAFDRVASPVLLVTADAADGQTQATFYELDKSGILDQNVGIDSIPVSGLSIEVFSTDASLGTFTTDAAGSIMVPGSPVAWVGEYKGIAFRFE